MSNLRVLVFPILIVSTLVFLWQFVKPIYDEGAKNRKSIPKIEVSVELEKNLKERVDKLFIQAEDSEADAGIVLKAIPYEKEVKNLIAQINYVVIKSGLSLEEIDVEDTSESVQNTAVLVPGKVEEYKKVNGSIRVEGSYTQFKLFLNELAKMNRLISVESISLKNSSNQNGENSGRYELKFQVYYFSKITPDEIKSGIESIGISS